jgi:hypothetical protein
MANKRTLKKNIHVIADSLFANCIAVSLYGNDHHPDNTDALLRAVVKLEDNYIRRVSHPEPKMKACEYFKDLIEKFNADASDLIDQING